MRAQAAELEQAFAASRGKAWDVLSLSRASSSSIGWAAEKHSECLQGK